MNDALILKQNLDDFEEFYDLLGEAHKDLNQQQNEALNAQLVLLLSNHIGNIGILRQACALARVNVKMTLPGKAP